MRESARTSMLERRTNEETSHEIPNNWSTNIVTNR